MPVNLLASLNQFKTDLEAAKEMYRKFKNDVESDPVNIGGSHGGMGGGNTSGTGAKPPLVVQPPRYEYQGGSHSSPSAAASGTRAPGNPWLKNPVFMAAARGAFGVGGNALHANEINQPQVDALARSSGMTPAQLQAAVMGGAHSSPTPGRSTSRGGPNGTPAATSIDGGWRAPADISGEGVTALARGLAPPPDKGGGGGGMGGFAGTLARRAVSALIIYGIAKELSSAANWATASALAGGDSGGQAAALSSFTKGVAPFGTGSFLMMGLDTQLALTGRQNELADYRFTRGMGLAGTQFGNRALAQGPSSAARSLAMVDRQRRMANMALSNNTLDPRLLQDEKDRDWTLGMGIDTTSGRLQFNDFFGKTYDKQAYASNEHTWRNFRETQTQQKKANDEEARLNARDIKLEMKYGTAQIRAGSTSQDLAAGFRPVAGQARGLSILAAAEGDRYAGISNPSGEDKDRYSATLGGLLSSSRMMQRDVNARIMGGSPVGFSSYRSAIEYRDPTQESLPEAQAEINRTLVQILDLLMKHTNN